MLLKRRVYDRPRPSPIVRFSTFFTGVPVPVENKSICSRWHPDVLAAAPREAGFVRAAAHDCNIMLCFRYTTRTRPKVAEVPFVTRGRNFHRNSSRYASHTFLSLNDVNVVTCCPRRTLFPFPDRSAYWRFTIYTTGVKMLFVFRRKMQRDSCETRTDFRCWGVEDARESIRCRLDDAIVFSNGMFCKVTSRLRL